MSRFDMPAMTEPLEHDEESEHCWCGPVLHYRDPITSVCVWVHRDPEDAH